MRQPAGILPRKKVSESRLYSQIPSVAEGREQMTLPSSPFAQETEPAFCSGLFDDLRTPSSRAQGPVLEGGVQPAGPCHFAL